MALFRLEMWAMPLFTSFLFLTGVFFQVIMHFLCGIVELAPIVYQFGNIFTRLPSLFSPRHGDPQKAAVM